MATTKTQVTEVKPPVATGKSPEATDKAYDANNQVNPALTPSENKEHERKEVAEKTEEHLKGAKAVDTKLGTSAEEKAAERAGVPEDVLKNPKQNREPKNEFERENQKVTDAERKAAQKESDLSTKERVEKAPEINEAAKEDAKKTVESNQGSEIAQAISEGLKNANGKKGFEVSVDDSVDHRFSVVKNAEGEVMVRENETGVLSKVQLKSLEEKEASLQGQKVEEI